MPVKSDKQKRFMNMVKARKMGHAVGGPKVQKAASSMTLTQIKDYVPDKPLTPRRSTEGMRKKLS